jgi:transcription antitermination factor NusG
MSLSVQVDLPSDLPATMLPSAVYQQAHWYAVCTISRHEKVVARQMCGNGLDHFLPLYKSVRRWKDRRKEVELPLFPGYVFVHIALRDRLCVQKLTGVLQIVSFNGRPAPLPENEIEALRSGLARNAWLEPHPYLKVETACARAQRTYGRRGRHFGPEKREIPACAFRRIDSTGGRRGSG